MPKGPYEIPRQLAEGYVFFDWFAIPQITARAKGLNEDLTRSDAAKAVQSIPFYVEVPEIGRKKGGTGELNWQLDQREYVPICKRLDVDVTYFLWI